MTGWRWSDLWVAWAILGLGASLLALLLSLASCCSGAPGENPATGGYDTEDYEKESVDK